MKFIVKYVLTMAEKTECETPRFLRSFCSVIMFFALSLLFFSCLSFARDFSRTDVWSDDVRYSSLESSLQPQCENLRETWFRLAPEDWQERLRGFQISPVHENMDLLFFSSEQWIWTFSQDLCSDDVAAGELQVLTLFGRMLALNGRSLSFLYLYPPEEDNFLQNEYLRQDFAHVSYGSFILFRPYQGLSLIPLKESMIARYAQQFWSIKNRREIYNYHWQALSKETVNEALLQDFDNPIDEFVVLWLAFIYEIPVPQSLSNKLTFIKKEEHVSKLVLGIRQKMLSS